MVEGNLLKMEAKRLQETLGNTLSQVVDIEKSAENKSFVRLAKFTYNSTKRVLLYFLYFSVLTKKELQRNILKALKVRSEEIQAKKSILQSDLNQLEDERKKDMLQFKEYINRVDQFRNK